MEFDFSRLRNGERIAAIGGVLLFVLLFFDWYDVSVGVAGLGSIGTSISAWDAFSLVDIYLMLVAFVAIGLAALTATQRTPALPVTASVITTAVAALGVLLILFRIVDTPGLGAPSQVDVSPTFWAFVGLVVAAAIAYGGYLSMREEGTTLGDVRAQASAAGQQARSTFEGGPPGTAQGSSAPPPPAAEPAAPPVAQPPMTPPPSDPPGSAPPPPSDAPPPIS
jgi:cation transport ATPase